MTQLSAHTACVQQTKGVLKGVWHLTRRCPHHPLIPVDYQVSTPGGTPGGGSPHLPSRRNGGRHAGAGSGPGTPTCDPCMVITHIVGSSHAHGCGQQTERGCCTAPCRTHIVRAADVLLLWLWLCCTACGPSRHKYSAARTPTSLLTAMLCTCCVLHPCCVLCALQLTGQPVLIGGTMGTCSYVLTGTDKGFKETFGSTCHGAGR